MINLSLKVFEQPVRNNILVFEILTTWKTTSTSSPRNNRVPSSPICGWGEALVTSYAWGGKNRPITPSRLELKCELFTILKLTLLCAVYVETLKKILFKKFYFSSIFKFWEKTYSNVIPPFMVPVILWPPWFSLWIFPRTKSA